MNKLIFTCALALSLSGCAEYPRASRAAGLLIGVPATLMGGGAAVELGMDLAQPSSKEIPPGYSEPIPELD